MSSKLKARCPHCSAILNIDRPDEPRIAPCPQCGGEIRIPQDVFAKKTTVQRVMSDPAIPLQAAQPVRDAIADGGRNLKLIVGSIGLLGVLYAFVIRGQGSELKQVMETAHEIDLQKMAAQREIDVEELKAHRARLNSDIDSLRSRLIRTDDTIRQLLTQPDLNISEIESAYEGDKK